MDGPEDKNRSLQDIIKLIKQDDITDDQFKFELNNQPAFKAQKNINLLAKAAVEAANKDLIVTLLEQGLNVNVALDIAVKTGEGNLIQLILDKGADLDEALYLAVKENNKKIIIFLLQLGGNINTNKKNGNTLLHTAILQKCDVDLIKFLMEQNLDTEVRNNNNKTALDLVKNFLATKNNSKTRESLEKIKNLLPEVRTGSSFECLQGLSDNLSCYSYQIKLFALYAIKNTKRSLTRICEYALSAEEKNLIPFDDIYLRKIENGQITCEFVQVKHTKKPESNMIDQSMFYAICKPEKNITKYLKGNDSIVKMFMQFDKITDTYLDNRIDGKFIYCKNTIFFKDPSPCFTRVNSVENDLLCGVKHEKWATDADYLYLEIKFVLLNLIQTYVQKISIIHEDLDKNEFNEQIELVDHLRRPDNIFKKRHSDLLWPVKNIANIGINVITKRISLLQNSKQLIKCSSNTETIKSILPNTFEIPDTKDIKVLIKRAVGKVKEVIKMLKCYINIFTYFSKYDEVVIQKKILNFVNHFYIYTGCPNNDDLDNMITKEVCEEFKLISPKFISAYCVLYFNTWISNFKNEVGKLFTHIDGKKFFSTVRSEIFKHFNESYIEELQTVKIKFLEDNPQVTSFLKNDNNSKILHVITENTRLHAIRIFLAAKNLTAHSVFRHLLKNTLFTNIETMLKLGGHCCLNDTDNLLIIECQNDIQDISGMCEILGDLRNIIGIGRKKLIIISSSNNNLAIAMKNILKDHIKISYQDYIEFSDLTTETQEAILNITVDFQNNPISIKSDTKIKDFITIPVACKVFDEDILSEIISNKELIKIGNNEAFSSDGYNNEYFIPRHLFKIDMIILNKCAEHLFFVTGVTREELIYKNKRLKKFINVWQDHEVYKEGIVVMPHSDKTSTKTNEEVFTSLSSNYKNSFWLEFKGELLYRKDNTLESTNKFEKMLRKYKLAPENIQDKIVIVANNPGEGKSTMLTDLAHRMRKKSMKLWIIRIDLKKYTDSSLRSSLKDITFNVDDTAMAIELVTAMVVNNNTYINSKLERGILQAILNGGGGIKVILLFDGYDEISPDFKEKTCKLLKALAKSMVTQLWVTTRNHLKVYLEDELQVSAYVLANFTEDEQAIFVSKFWGWHFKNYKRQEDLTEDQTTKRIINHLRTFLESFKTQNIISINFCYFNELFSILENESMPTLCQFIDNEMNLIELAKAMLIIWNNSANVKGFLSVPLHLDMLVNNTIQSEWKNVTSTKSIQLYEIYTEFVENKFKIHENNKSPHNDNQASREAADITEMILREMHCEIAVRSVFSSALEKALLPDLNICSKLQNYLEMLARVGLVKSYGNHYEFMHRSFGEYFLAKYIFRHINDPLVQLHLLSHILISIHFPLVRTFLNGFLSDFFDNCEYFEESRYPLKNALQSRVSERISIMIDINKNNVLHIAVRGGFVQIYLLIFHNVSKSTFARLIKQNTLEGLSVLQLAIQYQKADMINTIIETVKDIPNNFIFKLLPERFLSYLLNMTYFLLKMLEKFFPRFRDVLTFNMFEKKINTERWKFLNFFLDLIFKKNYLLTELISKCDQYQRSLLHIASSTGQSNSCELLLNAAKKHLVLNELILKLDKDNRTALHVAVIQGDKEICEIIVKSVEDNSRICKDLLTHISNDGQTVLHMAVIYNHFDICNMILKVAEKYTCVLEDLILKRDFKNQTALHLAAAYWHEQVCNVLLKCVEKYETILKKFIIQCDDKHQTALHIATECNKPEICNMILKSSEKYTELFNSTVMLRDSNDETALHIAAWKNYDAICYIILNYAVKNIDIFKDVVTQCDQYGQTALHVAALRGYSKVCFVILHIAKTHPTVLKSLLMQCDKYGYTALELAEKSGKREFCSVYLATILGSHYALRLWIFKINLKTKYICTSISRKKIRNFKVHRDYSIVVHSEKKILHDFISEVTQFILNTIEKYRCQDWGMVISVP